MSASQAMLRNWRRAAEDLGFKFISPFVLRDGEDVFECFGHVAEFGSPRGMVLMLEYDERLCRAAQEQGFGFSCFPEADEPYDRDTFVDILNDWGWSGPAGQSPWWYTGEPWSS